MSRRGLIIAGVALAAAGLLLWLIVRSEDDGASANPPQPPPYATGSAAGAGGAGGTPAPARAGDGSDRPNLPKVTAAEQARRDRADEEPATETIVNGIRVRDHRKDRSKPYTLVDPGLPSYARRIKPELTGAIVNQLLPHVQACGKATVPPEARGARPRVEGKIVIAIKDHVVHIKEAAIELTDVTGVSVDPIQTCIQQKAAGITAPATDEADLEDYPIRISYTLL
jgi:hypothetical protein